METKHTPTPYYIDAMNQDCVEVKGSNGDTVTYVEFNDTDEHIRLREHATAAFIVRACNAHDELVAALTLGLKYAESTDHFVEDTELMHAALRKARGEA